MSDKPDNVDDSSTHLDIISERMRKLNRIYDGALDWLESAVDARESKGTGTASMILKSTREELVAWENKGITQTDQRIHFDIPGLDFSQYNAEKQTDA